MARLSMSPGGSPSFVSYFGALQFLQWLAVDPEESGNAPLSFFHLVLMLDWIWFGLPLLLSRYHGTRDAVRCNVYAS